MPRLLEADITEVALYPKKSRYLRGSKLRSKAGNPPKPSPRTFKGKSTTKGRIKPKGISKLKRELDRLFSIYIRAKYPKECYTCGFKGKLQNGHFVSRMYLSTRWDEANCRPQCRVCNIWQSGRAVDFEEHLIKDLGREAVEELKAKRKILWKLTPSWYEAEIARYKVLVEQLTER